MSEIGQILLEKYYKATHVSKNSMERLLTEEISKRERNKIASSHSLVYMSQSPDYCVKNETLGSLGTSGR